MHEWSVTIKLSYLHSVCKDQNRMLTSEKISQRGQATLFHQMHVGLTIYKRRTHNERKQMPRKAGIKKMGHVPLIIIQEENIKFTMHFGII